MTCEGFLVQFTASLKKISFRYKNSSMLGRTHGQPAVPTTFGKELANYVNRLKKQQIKLKNFKFEGKLNGPVGNFNALSFTYPIRVLLLSVTYFVLILLF